MSRIRECRDAELKWTQKAAISRALLNFNITFAPLTMAVVCVWWWGVLPNLALTL